MPGIYKYSTTPANNVNSVTGITWDEGMSPGLVNNSARQNMADIRSQWNDASWFIYGIGDESVTATYSSGTAFTLAGADATSYWHANRRVKAVGTLTGTIYGKVSSSSYNSGTSTTTVNVTWDSGSLNNEALTVYASTTPVTGTPIAGEAIKGGLPNINGLMVGTAGAVLSGQIGGAYSRADAQLELRNTTSGQKTILSLYQRDNTSEAALSFQGILSDSTIPQMCGDFVRFPNGTNTAGAYNTVRGIHMVGPGHDNTVFLGFDNNAVVLAAGDTTLSPWNTVPASNTVTIRSGVQLIYGGTTLTAAVIGAGSMLAGSEGTWTPTLTFGGGSTGMSGTFTGYYKRNGNLIWASFNITLSAKGTSTGTALIGGLPTTSNANSFSTGGIWQLANMASLASALDLQVTRNAKTFGLIQTGATGTSSLSDTNFSNTSQIIGSVMYSVGSE